MIGRRKRDPLAHECRSDHPGLHNSGWRNASSIRYIVLHSTETPAGSAEQVARYFGDPSATGSANIVLDDFACWRSLGDHVIPWAAPPLNTRGFHIEQAGYARWSRAEWLRHEWTIRRAAYKASLRCRWYSIPDRLLDVEELRRDFGDVEHGQVVRPGAQAGGIVTHATVSEAFGLSDHTDPGAGYPLDVFLAHLREHLPAGFSPHGTITLRR